MKKNIYELKLHEQVIIKESPTSNDSYLTATRVPNGWIYESSQQAIGENEVSVTVTSVFVPYNEEFKPTNKGERF